MNSPLYLSLLLPLLFASAFAQEETHGSDAAKSMGPAAFMWPPDREWGAAQDNTAPCGSASGVMNRTDFPLGILDSIAKMHCADGTSQWSNLPCHARRLLLRPSRHQLQQRYRILCSTPPLSLTFSSPSINGRLSSRN